MISAHEYINGIERWCLWLNNVSSKEIAVLNLVQKRVDELRIIRENSSRPQLASIPQLFAQITQPEGLNFILIPRHSSENREYIPIGFFNKSHIAHDSCLIIPTKNIHFYSIITSKMHMTWLKAICGRLKSDYRYSKDIVYNNFPFPEINKTQISELENCAYSILEEREKYSEKTLAQLYDPDKMPAGLREAHHQNDLAVERCYRLKPFESDEERLEYLFKLYEQMIAKEKSLSRSIGEKGTLFEAKKKSRKK